MERLAKRGRHADFGWSGMAIIHRAMTAPFLGKLKRSGCRMLSYGLESGSQKMIDLMDKRFTIAETETVVRETHAAGIRARGYLLVGFPGETEEDFRMTVDLVRRLAPHLDQVSISFCEIYAGCDLDRRPEAYGIKAPIADRTRWESADGANTFEVRRDRCRRLSQAARDAGIDVVDVFASKLAI
jgi:radical SAM superfamily enzyme YgiQ (UPF0313 family)